MRAYSYSRFLAAGHAKTKEADPRNTRQRLINGDATIQLQLRVKRLAEFPTNETLPGKHLKARDGVFAGP